MASPYKSESDSIYGIHAADDNAALVSFSLIYLLLSLHYGVEMDQVAQVFFCD